ncbi:MAG: GTP 3',8-cyclase MoaA [Deltaproteobacteria bacterium]|nr:GTP 3',8-cyclase MoaA [Deltaproteobacteria bacterium]
MIDNYHRHISYLRISLTDRCNLRCIYCMPPEGIGLLDHAEVLRLEEIERIAAAAARLGISRIRITGGEPLVRRGVIDLVRDLMKLPGIEDVSLTTNGILLAEHAAALRSAGMRRINISLDTLDAEKYRRITRGGDIQRVLEGISEARRQGFSPIKVNVVAMRGINDDEIAEFARLTIERPVHIRFIEFMPVGISTEWDQNSFISSSETRDIISRVGTLYPVERCGKSGPAAMYRLEGAAGQLGFISPLSNHFCDTCNRMRLTADGKLRTCLFSDQEIDLKKFLRSSVSDQALEEIISEAIKSKPKGHTISEPSFKKCRRNMSAIGG